MELWHIFVCIATTYCVFVSAFTNVYSRDIPYTNVTTISEATTNSYKVTCCCTCCLNVPRRQTLIASVDSCASCQSTSTTDAANCASDNITLLAAATTKAEGSTLVTDAYTTTITSPELSTLLTSIFSSESSTSTSTTEPVTESLDDDVMSTVRDIASLPESTMKELGFQHTDMIVDCQYGGSECLARYISTLNYPL